MANVPYSSGEGLRAARLMMVISSLSPLFVLWAIRGNSYVPDTILFTICILLILVPLGILLLRILVAKREGDTREVVAAGSENNKDQVLVYLFSILLPFYRQESKCLREFLAMVVALVFIIFLFWHLNYHYMNIVFALCGYRIYTISPPDSGNRVSGREPFVLITRRRFLLKDDRIHAIRLSNSVYMETAE